MSIKLADAFQFVTDRKLLSVKAVTSLEVQKQTHLSKIKKAQNKIGRIDWILKKNKELEEELEHEIIKTLEPLTEKDTSIGADEK